MLNIVLFGAPGCGKGTQSELLEKRFALRHISTGNVIRQQIAAKSELGLQMQACIERGELAPDQLVIDMIADYVANHNEGAGVIFDGFPRTTPQAEALDKILAKSSEEVTATVSIMIPDEMVMERIKGRALKEGRADDASEDIINNRIATYHAQTEPLIEYYTKAAKYHEADGVGTIEEIRERIFAIMDRF